MSNWLPTASLTMLQQRADMLFAVRTFFHERTILEVDVPVLARAAVTDPNVDSFEVNAPTHPRTTFFLMTSPEFYLKRLVAAGSGPVYSLGHAFRAEHSGSRHQPEFTLLEWYRPGWTLSVLMDEVALLVQLFKRFPVRNTTYRQLFIDAFSIDPHTVSLETVKITAHEQLSPAFDSDDVSVWLDLLFSHIIEPTLEGMVFVEQFPAAQAALAKTTEDAWGNAVAVRFELYINGIEIANAYQEETSAAVLEKRFAENLRIRESRNQHLPPVDTVFLAAMSEGFPECAGVALGFDRLMMVVLNQCSINDVIPFAHH